MKNRKLILSSFMIALVVGLSVALSQAVSLAQETTNTPPAAQEATPAVKKSTHKGKKHMKGMMKKENKKTAPSADMTTPQPVK
ncbi:hypothetical protein EPN54_01730 [bacterium]|nr:MAG: hypothetical protein EPN54_01730 [bacterium]